MKTILIVLALVFSCLGNMTYYVVYSGELKNHNGEYTSSAAIIMREEVTTFNDVMIMRKEIFKICPQPIDSSTIVIMNFIKLNGGKK